jgi:hypothetical protein
MGVVGPEGLTQVCQIKRLRCLTVPGVEKRGLGLRGECLTFPSPYSTAQPALSRLDGNARFLRN